MRRDVASALASSGIRAGRTGGVPAANRCEEIDLTVLRKAIRAHPVHGCADRERAPAVGAPLAPADASRTRRWPRKVAAATGSLGQALDEIIRPARPTRVPARRPVTADGKMLARIWSRERPGGRRMPAPRHLGRRWHRPDLAAVVSCLVFESRRDGPPGAARTPSGAAGDLLATTRVWAEIAARERALGLPPTRDPDPGFAAAVAAWCRGASLAEP